MFRVSWMYVDTNNTYDGPRLKSGATTVDWYDPKHWSRFAREKPK
jgi:hypothetical protein